MHKFSERMSLLFFKKNYITLDQVDDITFALEIVFSNLASFLTILILGIVWNRYIETFLFFAVFIGFRTLRDRYHAPTFLQCYIMTVGSYLLCLGISLLISPKDQALFSFYIIMLNLLLLTHFYDVINKGETKQDNLLYNSVYILYNFICLLFLLFNVTHYILFLAMVGTIIIVTTIKRPKED